MLTASVAGSLSTSLPAAMVTDAAPPNVSGTGAALSVSPLERMPADAVLMVSGPLPSALERRTSTRPPLTVLRATKRQAESAPLTAPPLDIAVEQAGLKALPAAWTR